MQSLPHDDVDEEVEEKVDDEVGKEQGRWRRKKLGDEVEKGGGDQSVLPVIGRGVPPPLPYLQLPQSHLTPVQYISFVALHSFVSTFWKSTLDVRLENAVFGGRYNKL